MSQQATPSKNDKPGLPARDPFAVLRGEIDRVFTDFSRGFRLPDMFSGTGADLYPSMDVQETGGQVKLMVELPGVDAKDVEITTVGDTIRISGEKRFETEQKSGESYRRERSYGSFERRLTLPFAIDEKSVEAKFDKGVLTVTIAKPEQAVASARKIAIKS